MNRIKYIFDNTALWSKVTTYINSHHTKVKDSSGLAKFVDGLLAATQDQEIKTGSKPIVKGITKTFTYADQTQSTRFFSKTFSAMSTQLTELRSLLPSNQLPDDLIIEGKNSLHMFTRKFIAALLFGAFLGLFPGRIFNGQTPGLGFERFFSGSNLSGNQLSCFLSYFNHMSDFIENNNPLVENMVIFKRHSISYHSETFFTSSTNIIQPSEFISGFMEEYNPGNHVFEAIFGNKVVGSATLAGVMHQEEIVMTNAPETLVARIFHSNLGERETLTFRGLMKFSGYTGYSGGFKYAPITEEAMYSPLVRVYASFDALPDQSVPGRKQFSVAYSLRELNKLVSGLCENYFSESEMNQSSPFVTGNWGGGVFGGDSQYKFVIQLIAACVCNRKLVYSDNASLISRGKVQKIEQKYVTCGALATRFFALQHQGRINSKNTLDRLLE